MDQYSKYAIMLGVHESLLRYALDCLKGNTPCNAEEVVKYIENRLKEKHDEINGTDLKGNTESELVNAESTVRN